MCMRDIKTGDCHEQAERVSTFSLLSWIQADQACVSEYRSTFRLAVMPARAVPRIQERRLGAVFSFFAKRNLNFSSMGPTFMNRLRLTAQAQSIISTSLNTEDHSEGSCRLWSHRLQESELHILAVPSFRPLECENFAAEKECAE